MPIIGSSDITKSEKGIKAKDRKCIKALRCLLSYEPKEYYTKSLRNTILKA